MISNTDLPHQPDTLQQHPRSFKPQNLLALFTIVLLISLVAGTGGYLLASRNNQPNSLSLPSALPNTPTTKTVIIQDGYFFKVTIPHGYKLIKGEGDYLRYVTDKNDEKIIGFYFYSHLGESHPTGQTIIDGVSFTIDGGTVTNNRVDISCSTDLYATNAQFKIDHMYFGIYTWCKDTHKEQRDVYERIIRSIQFSEDLRAVLLGKSPPPILLY